MKKKRIDFNVTLYKGNQRLTEAVLDQLKKSNPSREELDKIHVKLEQTNY